MRFLLVNVFKAEVKLLLPGTFSVEMVLFVDMSLNAILHIDINGKYGRECLGQSIVYLSGMVLSFVFMLQFSFLFYHTTQFYVCQ